MVKEDKFIINKFIAHLNVFYDPKIKEFKDEHGVVVDLNKKILTSFFDKFKRHPTTKEYAYIEYFLGAKYDFDAVPYKIYLKNLVDFQDNKEIKELKTSYDNYLESLEALGAQKQCFYILGASGSGKTTYAKIFARKFYSEDEIYITSGGAHPFDEYYGEKCIILDDFRDSILAYNDLLRLLDNNTSSSVGARYHNKNLARCQVIILTSVKHPQDLYRNIEEERYQLYRRLQLLYISKEENTITLEKISYDKKNGFKSIAESDVTEEIMAYVQKSPSNDFIDIDEIFGKKKVDDDELPF